MYLCAQITSITGCAGGNNQGCLAGIDFITINGNAFGTSTSYPGGASTPQIAIAACSGALTMTIPQQQITCLLKKVAFLAVVVIGFLAVACVLLTFIVCVCV